MGADRLRGWREEPGSARESGWTFTCRARHPLGELQTLPVGVAVQRLPQILRYLALPPGSSLEWHADRVVVETGSDREPQSEDSDSGAWPP